MNIGLYFGSFNPIHIGHLIIANVLYESADLDEVWFIVSPLNPHKRDSKSLIHEFDRMDMVELAIRDQPAFRANDIEFNMPKPNYTINTLTYLQEKYPGYIFYLILGEDNLSSFPKWKNYRQILENHKILVYPRPDAKSSSMKQHPSVMLIDAPRLDISASFVRKCIRENKSVMYLVPEPVCDYIKRKKLYRD